MELMDCDLHRVIQSKQPLSEKHHKCFIKQIIEAIKAMHAIGVFHRDLKPGNILVSKDCQVRITDFGLARFMDESTRSGKNDLNPMTEYVVTRWYRPPELLLSPNRPYSEAIDMWSIGCILAELLRRKPLFPGKNHAHQVQLIFEVMGYNGEDLGFPVSGEAGAFLEKRCRYRKQSLSKFLGDASVEALSLVEALLTVNPNQRPSAVTSLRHSWLEDAEILHDYTKNYLQRPTPDYFDFEHEKYSVVQLKQMIDNEVFVASASAYRNSTPTNTSSASTSSPSASNNPSNASNKSNYSSNSSNPSNNYSNNSRMMAHASEKTLPEHDSNNSYPDNGPASQLATQQRGNQPIKGHENNPFRSSTAPHASSAQDASHGPTPNPIVDDQAIENIQGMTAGNILTTVRNDLGPPGTRGRKSIPKTPSPQKMDLILQKDLSYKQRYQQESSSASTNNNNTNNNSNNSYNNNNLSQQQAMEQLRQQQPRQMMMNRASNPSTNTSTTTTTTATTTNNRFGVPFPSLSRVTNALSGKNPLKRIGSSSRNVPTTNPYATDNNQINRSMAMVHSGNNIIQQDYSTHSL